MGNQQSLPPNLRGNGTWIWQSNSNPWDPAEPEEWQNYSPEISQKIEDAYLSGKKKVDIGSYYIRFEYLVQVKNKDAEKQRRVQRVVSAESRKIREDRFAGEIPKKSSVNPVFGSTYGFGHFLKIKYPSLSSILDRWKKEINDSLLRLVKDGLVKEADLLGDSAKGEANDIISEMSNFKVEEEFLKWALRTYTKESFVYSRVNKLLREEDWHGLENLAPFVYLITLAMDKMREELRRPSSIWSDLFPNGKVYLYRGAYLQKEVIAEYSPKKHKYFSWNALTSTSRNIGVAKFFATQSNTQPDKCPTLFTIIDEYRRYTTKEGLDVASFSVFPQEEEVILPPGTTFEIINYYEKEGVHYIVLKIKKDFDNLYENNIHTLSEAEESLVNLKECCMNGNLEAYVSNYCEQIAQEAVKLIADSSSLSILRVERTYMQKSSIEPLLKTLADKPTLVSLSLPNVQFSDEAFQLLADFLPRLHLKIFRISHDALLTPKSRQDLLYASLSQSKVDIFRIEQKSEKTWHLDSLPKTGPSTLELDCEKWTSTTLARLLKELSKTTIKRLNLVLYESLKLLKVLANHLPETSLEEVHLIPIISTSLSSLIINLDDEKFIELFKRLSLTKITRFGYLHHLTKKAITMVSDILFKRKLEYLALELQCGSNSEVAENFGKGLASSKIKTLHLLSLDSDSESYSFFERILPYLSQMTCLETLELFEFTDGRDLNMLIAKNLSRFPSLKAIYLKGCDKKDILDTLAEALEKVLPCTAIKTVLMPSGNFTFGFPFDQRTLGYTPKALIEIDKEGTWREKLKAYRLK